MPELAILLFPVHSAPHYGGEQDEAFPLIVYQTESQNPWQAVKDKLAQTGASRVLLQFSNESISIPEHAWRHLDPERRRYRRLFAAADIDHAPSPLWLIDLYPPAPLPDLAIQSEPLPDSSQSSLWPLLMYALQTADWKLAERLLERPEAEALPLLRSIWHLRTNRFEEGLQISQAALDKESGQSETPLPEVDEQSRDDALLWRVYGILAARCGREKAAGKAFRSSFLLHPGMDPLLDWADELLQQNRTADEIASAVQGWLEATPEKEVYSLLLLNGLGLYPQALEILEKLHNNSSPLSPSLARIYFQCLVRAGRHEQARSLLQVQGEAYSSRYPIDGYIGKLLDGEPPEAFAKLPAYELEALLEHVLALRLFSPAESLAPLLSDSSGYAHLLYRNGFVMRAASRFLALMHSDTLAPAGLRCLAEILYFRGAYQQAAGIFEYLLAAAPDDAGLRTALALACLRQSEKLLGESMYIFPSSAFLREEADKVEASIRRMEQSHALTCWRLAERANFHA